jgi:hypothetical protein
MPDQLQLRGGTTTEHATFTGASKEVTIDTTKKTAVVHDASTAGGNPLMREDGANSALVNGSATEPALAFAAGDADNGIYSPGTDQVAITTNGVERVEWGASEVVFNDGGADYDFRIEGDTNTALFFVDAGEDTVGINVANPDARLHVVNGNDSALILKVNGADTTTEYIGFGIETGEGILVAGGAGSTSNSLVFKTSASGTESERARIDSSGRLLIGATTAPITGSTALLQAASTGGAAAILARNDSAVTASDIIGQVLFAGNDGGTYQNCGRIMARAESAHAHDDKPTYLSFETTPSGAGSPTERMRITSAGQLNLTTSQGTAGLPTFLIDNTNTGGYAGRIVFGSKHSSTAFNAAEIQAYGGTSTTDGSLAFETGGSESVRIDGSGRLLVGTTSSIGASTDARETIQAVDASGARLLLGRNDATISADATIGHIQFRGNADGTWTSIGAIYCTADGTHATSDKPTRLSFLTTPSGSGVATERIRLEEDGQFNLYTHTNLVVRSVRTSASESAFVVQSAATTTLNGTTELIVYADGDVENTNGNYTAISDERFKENIVDANSQWDDIKAVRVRNFNFKEETGRSTHTQLGVVAQEIELISPGLVKERKNPDTDETHKSVSYSLLYMKAVKALQEAMERIETLEAKVAALEAN